MWPRLGNKSCGETASGRSAALITDTPQSRYEVRDSFVPPAGRVVAMTRLEHLSFARH